MDARDLQKRILGLVKSKGERAVQALLVEAGASPNTAQKLTSGRYPNEPQPLLRAAILQALTKGRSDTAAS